MVITKIVFIVTRKNNDDTFWIFELSYVGNHLSGVMCGVWCFHYRHHHRWNLTLIIIAYDYLKYNYNHLIPMNAMSSCHNVFVIYERSSTIESSSVGKHSHPRVLVHVCGYTTNDSVLSAQSSTSLSAQFKKKTMVLIIIVTIIIWQLFDFS